MKKIMKKALSLMLALVMVFTLAPMTAMAATGDQESPAALPSVDGSTIDTTLNDTYTNYYYEWTATADGVLTLAFDKDSTWSCEIINATKGESEKQASSFDGVSSAAIAVLKDNVYLIGVQDPNGGTAVSFSATFEAGAKLPGSEASVAIDITSSLASNALAQGAKEYYVITGDANKEYSVVVTSNSGAATVYAVAADGEETSFTADANTGATTATVTASNEGKIIFAIQNTGMSWFPATFTVTYAVVGGTQEPVSTVGTQGNPEVITEHGDKTGTCTALPYWCKYTATQAGVLTVTVVDAEEPTFGVYTVNDGWDYNAKSTDTSVEVELKVNDVALFYVRDFANTTVDFTTSFEPGATLPVDDNTDDETGEGGEVETNYEMGDEIVVGDNALAGPSSYLYTYTVHKFTPDTVGKYTFTTTDSTIGIVSDNGMWITAMLPDATEADPNIVPYNVVTEKEIVWECTGVGQGIWIAVFPDANSANIKVTKEELVIKEIPTDYYEVDNTEAYVFNGNVADLTYVNVEDTTVDKAVKGEDGFYHLNEKTGPILLVNLDDVVMPLVSTVGDGLTSLKAPVYEGDELVKYIDYINALNACIENSDAFTHSEYGNMALYPLTDALIGVYTDYAESHAWYDSVVGEGVVSSQFKKANAEDIWMFACLYVPNAEDGTMVVPPVVVEPETNNEISKDTLQAAIDKAVAENRDLVVETTADGVVMTFAPADLKDAEAVALNIEVAIKNDVKDETVAKNDKITEDNFVLKIEFAHDGPLPAEATITIPVSADLVKGLEKLFYYEIKADGTLEFVCEAPIKDGYVTVKQAHCSDYVLLKEKIEEPVVTPDPEEKPEVKPEATPEATPEASTTPNEAPTTTSPKTGDSTDIALWVAILGLGVVAIAGSVVMKKREF